MPKAFEYRNTSLVHLEIRETQCREFNVDCVGYIAAIHCTHFKDAKTSNDLWSLSDVLCTSSPYNFATSFACFKVKISHSNPYIWSKDVGIHLYIQINKEYLRPYDRRSQDRHQVWTCMQWAGRFYTWKSSYWTLPGFPRKDYLDANKYWHPWEQMWKSCITYITSGWGTSVLR